VGVFAEDFGLPLAVEGRGGGVGGDGGCPDQLWWVSLFFFFFFFSREVKVRREHTTFGAVT
jgi:hypothetical protein